MSLRMSLRMSRMFRMALTSDATYRAFHRFGLAKFADGGLMLGSSQFTLLHQLPLKMILHLKKGKIDSKNHLVLLI
jgi:hypothetical protein